MLNTVIIEGRLTKDPELKTTPNGISVSTFAVAVARDYKNANGEYDSDFFECVAWRNNAERISKYFHKGDGVGIVGRLQTRTYKDKNGVLEMRTLLRKLCDENGTTIIMSSHYAEDIEALCDTVCEMDGGVLTKIRGHAE